MLIKIRPNAIGIRQSFFSNNASNAPELYMGIESANTIRVFMEGGDRLISTAQTFNVNQWNSIGISYHTDNSIEVYLDGANVASGSFTKTGTTDNPGAIIGGLSFVGTNTFDVDGELAEFAFYNEALLLDEHAAYADGFSPKLIRPGGLVSYVPIIGNGFSEYDEILGEVWLKNGTLTKSDHPPVFMPSPAIIGIPVAAAGGAITGTSTISLAGSGTLTGSGALSGATAISLAPTGALTGSGALAGAAALSLTPSGTLVGTGALSGSAALSISLSGTLSGKGELIAATTISFTLTGTLTGTGGGAITGNATLSLTPSGTLTGAGALIGSVAIDLTLSGTLINAAAAAPASRTCVVAAQDRTKTIEAQSRTITVPAQNRTPTA